MNVGRKFLVVPQTALVDIEVLRSIYAPRGEWAMRCGAAVRSRRQGLAFSMETLAELCGTTLQTIGRIEKGSLVPREHLKAAIAYALAVDVVLLWPALTRAEIHNRAAA